VSQPSYTRRDRAESFGAVAADYDRYRPSYPAELIDELVGLAPAAVLDIGCGTGKAATLLAARGLNVLGVEVDPAMAAVARGHGLTVEVGSFESWDAAGRTFDLITCAQAWHWIDPAIGIDRAADLLQANGGTLALFWNYGEPDGPALRAMDAIYAQVAPELSGPAGPSGFQRLEDEHLQPLRDSGRFAAIETRAHPWQRGYSAEEWTAMVRTHSDHLQLAPEHLLRLLAALEEMIAGLGGELVLNYTTYAILARMAG
jgi:SAM-dependent methyltransferase